MEPERNEDHPEVQKRLAEIVRLGTAAMDQSNNETISDRVRIARMRMLYKEALTKLTELRAFCMETGDWKDEERYEELVKLQ